MSLRRGFLGGLSIGLATLIGANAAPASTVFSNFGPGLSYNTSAANPIGNAFDGNNYAVGAAFTSSSSFVFTSLSIALSCSANCPAASAFTLSLARDNSNQPGSRLESFTLAGGSLGTLGRNNAPMVMNSSTGLVLNANTRYWITVSATPNDSLGWNLNSSGDTSEQALSTDAGATWFSPSGNTPGAAEVDGTLVPEPGGAALLIGGALVLSLWRKRSGAI